MTTITLSEKDKGNDINFTVKDTSGNVVDLTGATAATFKVGLPGESLLISGVCTIIDAPNGSIRYTLGVSDLLLPGRYRGELKVAFGSSKTVTVNSMFVDIRSSL